MRGRSFVGEVVFSCQRGRQRETEGSGLRVCLMEYYAPAKGAPSSFVGLEGGSVSDSTGVPAVLGSIPYDDWHVKHGVPSPGSTAADTGVEGRRAHRLAPNLSPSPSHSQSCRSTIAALSTDTKFLIIVTFHENRGAGDDDKASSSSR